MDNNIENINIENSGKKSDKSSKILIWALSIITLLLAGSLIWLYFMNNDSNLAKSGLKNANGKISELQTKINDLSIQVDTTKRNLIKERTTNEMLQHENDSMREIFPILIKKLEVANADGGGRAISAYGKDIVASSSMYLMPRITYHGFLTGETIELKVRLYGADGKCVTGDSSPDSFSYTYKINPVRPGDNTLSLSGWGGGDRGHFAKGVYRYEVWYEDMCLKAVTFNLK